MKVRFLAAGISIFLLALRRGVGLDESLLLRVGLASALTAYWGAAFWLFKIYGIAVECMGASQFVRRLLEYGLPLAVLAVILHLGPLDVFDVGLAIVIWLLVGTSLTGLRNEFRPSAEMHARRFLHECGFDGRQGGDLVNIWPLHVAVLGYAGIICAVPGIQ